MPLGAANDGERAFSLSFVERLGHMVVGAEIDSDRGASVDFQQPMGHSSIS